jgi:hypothetical protein
MVEMDFQVGQARAICTRDFAPSVEVFFFLHFWRIQPRRRWTLRASNRAFCPENRLLYQTTFAQIKGKEAQ